MNQLKEIEVTIEDAKEKIELADALNRLHDNEDFKKVILNGYFKKEAQRAVMLKSDPNMQSVEEQKNVDNVILGIGQLGMHFHKIFIFGEGAKQALREHEKTREEILAEELEGTVVN